MLRRELLLQTLLDCSVPPVETEGDTSSEQQAWLSATGGGRACRRDKSMAEYDQFLEGCEQGEQEEAPSSLSRIDQARHDAAAAMALSPCEDPSGPASVVATPGSYG